MKQKSKNTPAEKETIPRALTPEKLTPSLKNMESFISKSGEALKNKFLIGCKPACLTASAGRFKRRR